MIELSIIVPVFNESADLWPMAQNLAPHLDRIAGAGKWQFILADNGSTDASPQIIGRIKANWPTTVGLRLSRPDYGEALVQALMAAEGGWGYVINVDFWDSVFLSWCWRNRTIYDLVLGSKRADPALNHQHRYRRLLSWGLNSILQFRFGFVGSDTHGQKFLSFSALRPLISQTVLRRGQFDTELTLRTMRQGLWIAEVPVPIHELRPPRNLMLGKIRRNLIDIMRLSRVMRLVPANRPIRYHRWAREDIEQGEALAGPARVLMEHATRHRQAATAPEPATDAAVSAAG
jgi:glycosyltransferase involved in cell wall biosynthesis